MDFLVSLEKAQIVPTVCGSLSFALTMVLSTTLQHKFRISTGATNAMLPILTGVFTVGMGSLASNKVSRETLRYINGHNNDNWWQSSPTNYRSKRPTNNLQLTSHYTRITLLGLLTYRVLLNSRFMSVAPSSFTNLGAFAKKGIPATLEYATGKERRTIQMLGKDFGCHTCGVKGRVKFNADHMPPLSIVKRENMKFLRKWKILPKVRQKFYPQCEVCSNVQGGLLSSAMSVKNNKNLDGSKVYKMLKKNTNYNFAYNHALRPRVGWLGGVIVAWVSVWGGGDPDGDYIKLRRLEQSFFAFWEKWG